MRSRAILTMAAATATTLGGVLASAGTAAAAIAPKTAPAPPAAPRGTPTPGVLAVENAVELVDDWCVAPLHFAGPLVQNPIPTTSDMCDADRHDDGDGFRVLSDLCIAPITADDPTGSGPAPSRPCRPGATGPGFGIARNVSVAGVQATF